MKEIRKKPKNQKHQHGNFEQEHKPENKPAHENTWGINDRKDYKHHHGGGCGC
jgi:hypothetical protein